MNRLDYIFRKELKNYHQKAPDDIWDGIEMALEKKRKVNIFHRVAAAAVVLIVSGTAITTLFLKTNQLSINESFITANQEVNKEINNPEANTKESVQFNSENSIAQVQLPEKNNKMISQTSINKENNDIREQNQFKKLSPRVQFINNTPPKRTIELIDNSNTVAPIQNSFTPAPFIEESVAIEKKKSSGISVEVGGQLAPIYSFRNLTSSSEVSTERKYYNEVESGIVAFAGGIQVDIKTSKRFSVQTGISYSKIGQQLENMNIYVNNSSHTSKSDVKSQSFSIHNSLGTIDMNSPYYFEDNTNKRVDVSSRNEFFIDSKSPETNTVNATLTQTFEYLEVPLLLKYKLIDRKIDISFSAGLSGTYLVSNNVALKYDDKSDVIGSTAGMKTFNYTSLAGIDISYPINPHLRFHLNPMGQYYLNSVNSGDIESHPYSFALYTGLSISF